jgi:ferredoxin
MKNDGLAYVKEGDKVFSALDNNPQGAEGQAEVPKSLEDAVVESAEECPGECIFVVP